jgi:hypothetical protein
MAVVKAPVRQQSYLTEYDRMMAEYLRQMGAGIGPQDIASEAYGGKFPVGTMTAKILSGVLAGASDRRAINREERSKDFYSRAREIVNAMDNPRLSTDASTMSINPNTGNFQYVPTGEKTTSTWGFEDYENEAKKRINAMGNFENLSEVDKEKAREVWRTQGPLPETFEASSYSPTGIPNAPKDITEDMRYTVGEKAPEDSTQLGRYLSGTLPQDVLPINAEKALSQALRGANVPEFQFDEYRQNKRIQDMANARAEEEYQYQLSKRGNIEYGEPKIYYGKNEEGGKEIKRGVMVKEPGQIPYILDVDTNKRLPLNYTDKQPTEVKLSQQEQNIQELMRSDPTLSRVMALKLLKNLITTESTPGGQITRIDETTGKILNEITTTEEKKDAKINEETQSLILPFTDDAVLLQSDSQYDDTVRIRDSARKGIESANELIKIIEAKPRLVTGIEGKINRLYDEFKGRNLSLDGTILERIPHLLNIKLDSDIDPDSAKAITLLRDLVTSVADAQFGRGGRTPTDKQVKQIEDSLGITNWLKSPDKAIDSIRSKGDSLFKNYAIYSTQIGKNGVNYRADPNFISLFPEGKKITTTKKLKYNPETGELE